MVDAYGMAEQHSIQDLEESMLGEIVVPNESALLSNVGEKIAFRAKFKDHKSAVGTVEDADQGHHVGMLASLVVESYLLALNSTLTGIKTSLGKSFDGVGDVCQDINGLVDSSKRADSKDGHELQTPS